MHLNVADFAVAVERVVDARLRDRPVIVAPQGAARAAVYDMSEEAYQAGVRKGMALRRALRFCHEARVLAPHPDRYERAMEAFLKHLLPYSPRIEAGEGNGHLFADLTGTGRLLGAGPDVAWRVRQEVRADLRLDPIWAVAPNKLVAKAATRVVKPAGEYIVEAGDEENFLRPLPLSFLPGLEGEDLACFREFHVVQVAQATCWTPAQLEVVFGRRALHIHRLVRGQDASPVLPVGSRPPSAHAEYEFGEDTNDLGRLESVLYGLVERVGRELRAGGRATRRVGVLLDFSDGVRVARQRSWPAGTAHDVRLFDLARQALSLALMRRVRVRHLKLSCDRLVEPPAQLELFPFEAREILSKPHERLDAALDEIRGRFGPATVRLGRTLWGEGRAEAPAAGLSA